MSNKPLRTAVALGTLACGILGSLLAGWQVKRATEEEARAKFEGVCEELTTRIRERLTSYTLMLQGGQALMAASEKVERGEWHTYLETLRAEQTVPGYQAIGYAELVPAQNLARHVAAVRGEGFPGYAVRPEGSRPFYAPVIFIEPFAGRNPQAFGFDMLSEPVRREAMEKACDDGQPALTGKLKLVQNETGDTQPGAIMYAPVYRKGAPVGTTEQRREALEGWIFGAYRMNDLMMGIVPDWFLLGHRFPDLHVYEGDAVSPDKLLFDSMPGGIPHGAESFLHKKRTLDLTGRHWLLVFNGSAAAEEVSLLPAWLTTIGGLLASGLLFGMMLLAYKRHDAQATAEDLAERVRGMAFHDSLTKLPNRLLLRDRLEMALAGCKRSGCHGALMMVDLDNFKPLNDAHGHAAGDLLLIEVATRIRGCVRETDTVARIGGDEFIVLLASLSGGEDAARREATAVADKICAVLSRPYLLAPEIRDEECIEHHCSSSIGITLFSAEDASQSEIIKRADAAMYGAKRSGRNRTHFDATAHLGAHAPRAALQEA